MPKLSDADLLLIRQFVETVFSRIDGGKMEWETAMTAMIDTIEGFAAGSQQAAIGYIQTVIQEASQPPGPGRPE